MHRPEPPDFTGLDLEAVPARPFVFIIDIGHQNIYSV